MTTVNIIKHPQIGDRHMLDVRVEFTGLELGAKPEAIVADATLELSNALHCSPRNLPRDHRGNALKVREHEHVEQFFAFSHLPPHLQRVSKLFSDLVTQIVETLPCNPERTKALDALLIAKDAAVRALVAK